MIAEQLFKVGDTVWTSTVKEKNGTVTAKVLSGKVTDIYPQYLADPQRGKAGLGLYYAIKATPKSIGLAYRAAKVFSNRDEALAYLRNMLKTQIDLWQAALDQLT